MSLRILIKPAQIQNWLAQRNGTVARRRNTDADFAILFGEQKPEFEAIGVDEFVETMKLQHLVLLVDEEPGKTFHQLIEHG